MKKKIAVAVGIWLSGAVFMGSGAWRNCLPQTVPSIQAAGKSSQDIQKEIDQKNKQQQSAKQEKQQLEKEIKAMEAEKKDVASYIQSLDQKLDDLSEKMEKNQENITQTKEEIKRLRSEKKEAQAAQKKQYDTMKKRIKYMYENGNDGYLELLLGADSLSELFNRAEYVTRVSGYDRNMLANYKKVCKKIATAEKKIEKKLVTLTDMRESLQVEKSSVNELVDKKTEEVRKYQNLIADKNANLSDTETLLASQEEELEKLMAAQRAAVEREEAAKKKKANKSNSQNSASETKNNSGGYCWPLTSSGRISSYFGYRTAPTEGASSFHKGIDIAVPVGTGVLAANSGTVVTATYSASAGNYVAISHGNGVYTYYMHCSSLCVKVGQSVSKGKKVALSGNSGISTGPHLHFAVFAGGSYVNPLNYVSQ